MPRTSRILITIVAALAPLCAQAQVVRPNATIVKPPAGGISRPQTTLGPTPAPTGAALQSAIAGAAMKKHRNPTGAHTFYGTIASLGPNALELRLRDGRNVPVATAFAIASDNYSAPLFVGKTVVIDGTRKADGTFEATHIFRVQGLQELPADN